MDQFNYQIFAALQAGITNEQIVTELRQLKQLSPQTRAIAEGVMTSKLQRQFASCESIGFLNSAYPEVLRQTYDAPALLFYQGDLSLLQRKAVTFVGARQPNTISIKTTEKLVKGLPKDIAIVTGLQVGIQTAAAYAAVKSNLPIVAVLGNGLDVYYPRLNKDLQKHIAKNGLLLSEYPLSTPPLRQNFPERGRIMAALAESTIVIEAKKMSGSMHVAQRAIASNHIVMAVPGEIVSGDFSGSNELLAQGACPVTDSRTIVDNLPVFRTNTYAYY
jgi:DNA processing protein